jgi:L-lysine exporter family protein LysE/ArgO
VGGALASAAWFMALGFGARWLAPVFASPAAWRVLDAVTSATMMVLAGVMVLS